MAKKENKKIRSDTELRDIIYNTHKNNTVEEFKKYKLPNLKEACKKYNLKVTGNKGILIERIQNCFLKMKCAIIIQSIIRMNQSNIYIHQRGPALKDKKICCNMTDFVTLEPLDEISLPYFFSYRDNEQFVYGFNICSLISLLKSGPKKFINPYNRKPFDRKLSGKIIKIYNNNFFINSEFKEVNTFFERNPRNHTNHFLYNIRNNPHVSTVDNYNPQLDNRRFIASRENQDRLNYLSVIRQTTNISTRIERLFMEVDNLGNYTNSSWFNNLTHMQYIRLYRCIWDVWNYRGQLNGYMKRQICPFYDPFEGIFPRRMQTHLSLEQIKKGCLLVFENLVYSSSDIELRKIGALHCLSSLTLVSNSARIALPYLYESIA